MLYEVENKFPVPDHAQVTTRLTALHTTFHEPIEQVDLYFAHPVRDFATTDEALRIRRVGDRNFITYKGPKLDTATKTRRELELPLATGTTCTAAYRELLETLGFRAVAEVTKTRCRGELRWEDYLVEVALDRVERLGTFVELEIQVDHVRLPDAQAALLSLAEQLGLAEPERRSYLEMLLASPEEQETSESRKRREKAENK